ncbi:MAG: SIR2 family protein [Rhizobacter sp.]|nr:SIR2 family protein [Rhizobacter sp.]
MSELQKLGVPPEDISLLLRAMDDGAVNLLTGAGASYGVTGGDGQELKGGPDLARELNARFGLENVEPDCSNLQVVYGDISAVPAHKATLAELLRDRFTKCRVTWQEVLVDFPWKRIWTLNIDDVLQRAAGQLNKFQAKSFAWDDSLSVRQLSQSEVQIVHLHGRGSQIDTAVSRIIFSLRDYAARHEVSPGWHAEFRSEFIRKPFVVCGARLRDEFDLATVLDIGNKSRDRGGCPSFIVLREFSPGEEARFRRQGLVPVAATGEAFFRALRSDLDAFRLQQPTTTPQVQTATTIVRSSFRQLLPTALRPRRLLDFYASAEAQWHHILDGLDAPLDQVMRATTWLQEQAPDARVVLIGGGPVCGKTASALRIAASLQDKGYEAWLFRGEERFDEGAVSDYLASRRPTVLVFDDCADFSNSLTALIAAALKRKLPLRIVAAAEAWRIRGVHADLRDASVRLVELEPVPEQHFDSIFSMRRQKGRLGRCTGMKPQDAWFDFKDHFNRRSLEWLESLEGARSYRQVITDVLTSATSSPAERRLALTCAAAHRFGYSLPFQFASAILGNSDLENFVAPPSPYADLAYLDDKGLRLRSRSFAIHVWALASPKERYDITLHLAKQLSPLVVPQAIARRTYAYRILRVLMDCDVIAEDLPESADRWYSELLPTMGWNSRFWEQRALLAARRNQDETAYSFAKTAVSIQARDAFSHTTLGTICMQISIRRADDVGIERFWEGTHELEASRKLALEKGNEWEHPYVTFFTYAARACRVYPSQTARISRAWEEWMSAADGSNLFRFDVQGQNQLSYFKRQWLSLAVRQT